MLRQLAFVAHEDAGDAAADGRIHAARRAARIARGERGPLHFSRMRRCLRDGHLTGTRSTSLSGSGLIWRRRRVRAPFGAARPPSRSRSSTLDHRRRPPPPARPPGSSARGLETRERCRVLGEALELRLQHGRHARVQNALLSCRRERLLLVFCRFHGSLPVSRRDTYELTAPRRVKGRCVQLPSCFRHKRLCKLRAVGRSGSAHPMWKLVIEDDETKRTSVPLTRDDYTIGRKEGNTIRLTERNVSREHAKIHKRRTVRRCRTARHRTPDSPFVLEDVKQLTTAST